MYLDPIRKRPLPVVITLEPIRVFYSRISGLQTLPLDLYYAMEHFIESIDVVHTLDNELGLLHTADFWVGVLAYNGRREFDRLVREYESFVARAGFDPKVDLCFARDLVAARHPLLERFRSVHRRWFDRMIQADATIRRRIRRANRGEEALYVIMRLPGNPGRDPGLQRS